MKYVYRCVGIASIIMTLIMMTMLPAKAGGFPGYTIGDSIVCDMTVSRPVANPRAWIDGDASIVCHDRFSPKVRVPVAEIFMYVCTVDTGIYDYKSCEGGTAYNASSLMNVYSGYVSCVTRSGRYLRRSWQVRASAVVIDYRGDVALHYKNGPSRSLPCHF